MSHLRRSVHLGMGVALVVGLAGALANLASPAGASSRASHSVAGASNPPFRVKSFGRLANGSPRFSSSKPTGLSPTAVEGVYNLTPSSTSGNGQIIAIVDAYHDPNALSDLNAFDSKYGYAKLSTCTSLSQSGPCFLQADPQGTPKVNSGWVLEESLDIEWAHAEAPAAKIVLVEAATNSNANLFSAVSYANSINATEVSMSWSGGEANSEASLDSTFTHPGTLYTASSGDSGHGTGYPAASPNVIGVGGTTLNGCSGTTCNFTSETAWSGSGGGASSVEAIPGYQSSYAGPVSGASTISGLTGALRGIPDVSFDANPNTGVSVYDSTRYSGQSGWFTLGGTSVGAPNWAGILAAGAAAGKTALQGNSSIYAGGYSTNLRDVVSGTNGSCGTDCTAGSGYDLVTGLGSPVNYP